MLTTTLVSAYRSELEVRFYMATRKSEVSASNSTALVAGTTDLEFAREVGTTVAGFLKRAQVFFAQAGKLEETALDLLALTRDLRAHPVTNAHEDARLQELIVTVNAHRRVVTDHWSITSVVHKLHRRLTARRDLAVDACEEASKIANNLHNSYVLEQERKAEAERKRLQAIEDARAKKQRDDELAALDEEAAQAELGGEGLSERESLFVTKFLSHGYGVRAAREAGYLDPEKQFNRLGNHPKILAEIARRKTAEAARAQAEAIRQQPVQSVQVEVHADVTRLAGTKTVTRWSAEVVDEAALVAAVFQGRVPADVLKVDPVKLNEYARSLKGLINDWPGVRGIEKKGLV